MVMSNKQHGWKVTHHANARHGSAGCGASSLGDRIELGVLLGAGSFGRVYKGKWQGEGLLLQGSRDAAARASVLDLASIV